MKYLKEFKALYEYESVIRLPRHRLLLRCVISFTMTQRLISLLTTGPRVVISNLSGSHSVLHGAGSGESYGDLKLSIVS